MYVEEFMKKYILVYLSAEGTEETHVAFHCARLAECFICIADSESSELAKNSMKIFQHSTGSRLQELWRRKVESENCPRQ